MFQGVWGSVLCVLGRLEGQEAVSGAGQDLPFAPEIRNRSPVEQVRSRAEGERGKLQAELATALEKQREAEERAQQVRPSASARSHGLSCLDASGTEFCTF